MKIMNIKGLTAKDLRQEVENGGRFIYFPYAISLLVITLKRESNVYLVREHENRFVKSLPFTILSLVFGWWAIPFGPKNAWGSIRKNMSGGIDVTDDVMATFDGYELFEESEAKKKNVQQ